VQQKCENDEEINGLLLAKQSQEICYCSLIKIGIKLKFKLLISKDLFRNMIKIRRQ